MIRKVTDPYEVMTILEFSFTVNGINSYLDDTKWQYAFCLYMHMPEGMEEAMPIKPTKNMYFFQTTGIQLFR